MVQWSKRSLKAGSIRLVGYSALLLVLAWLAHLYVSNPLYIKKLPYFADAFRLGFEVECNPSAPDALSGMLKKVSLPYFALNGQVVTIDEAGKTHSCRVQHNDQAQEGMFRFASMTKVVTAFAVLELARENEINLDSKVVEFFPEVEKGSVQDSNVLNVTLNQLMNHSSGLGGPFGSDNMIEKGEQPWCPYDIKQLETIRLAGKPGSNHLYSNVAYCLLGEVVARATGVDFQRYISDTYLSDYPTLRFVRGTYLTEEPEYDFSNEYRFGKDYIDWLDFHALASSAGLMGDPREFAQLVRELVLRNPGVLHSGGIEGCREKELERCYSYPFVVIDADQGLVGIQQGYLPGASSLVAVTPSGEVLVWVAAGAALEGKYKDLMVDRVVAFLKQREQG